MDQVRVGWLYWCFTAFRHILCHFGRGHLTYLHCSWASLLGSLPVLSAHSFATPVADNCPSWILGRERMVVENFQDQISTKECFVGRENRTRDRPHTRQTRIRSHYRARLKYGQTNKIFLFRLFIDGIDGKNFNYYFWPECLLGTRVILWFDIPRLIKGIVLCFSWYAHGPDTEKRVCLCLCVCVCEFGFNVAFNNFSVISRRCLLVTGSSMLTFIVLPHWSIMS